MTFIKDIKKLKYFFTIEKPVLKLVKDKNLCEICIRQTTCRYYNTIKENKREVSKCNSFRDL